VELWFIAHEHPDRKLKSRRFISAINGPGHDFISFQMEMQEMSFIAKANNVGEYFLIRHEGELTKEGFEEGRSSAKIILDQYNWKNLLVDVRGVDDRISFADVYYIMESNASVLPYIKIALLFPPERREDGIFAAHVAMNRGSHSKSFIDYNQAVAWLIDDPNRDSI
jgi:hypothetical protein